MSEREPDRSEEQIAAMLGIGQYRKHLLLCVGPNCCSSTHGLETWSHLKLRLKELTREGLLPPTAIYRSKVSCVRICRGGPILVVYPEGTWYRGVTPEVCERILMEHIGAGQVVEEFAFAHNPLFAEPEE